MIVRLPYRSCTYQRLVFYFLHELFSFLFETETNNRLKLLCRVKLLILSRHIILSVCSKKLRQLRISAGRKKLI